MLIIFEYLYHILSILLANSWIICSRTLLLQMHEIFIPLIFSISLLTNLFSSLLFLISMHLLVRIYSSKIKILTVRRAWSDVSFRSEWMIWLLYSNNSGLRNIRSITEFEFYWLSEYIVEICLVGLNNSKQKKLAISKRFWLWWEW